MTPSVESGPAREGHTDRPIAGVGAILRGARLARDEELREVAAALRIRLPYLEAIESGAIEELPGITYGIGFVRAYSEYLGLDTAEVVDRFKVEARGMAKRTQLQFPEPLPGNLVPGGALLLIVLVLAGAVYGGWLYTSSQNMTVIEAVEAVPERLMALVTGSSVQPGEPTPAPAADIPVPDAPAADTAAADTAAADTAAADTAATDTSVSGTASEPTATDPPGVSDPEDQAAVQTPDSAADPLPADDSTDAETTPSTPQVAGTDATDTGPTEPQAPETSAAASEPVLEPAPQPALPEATSTDTAANQSEAPVQADTDADRQAPTVPEATVTSPAAESAPAASALADPPPSAPEAEAPAPVVGDASVPRPEPAPEPATSSTTGDDSNQVGSNQVGLVSEDLDAPAANEQAAGVSEAPADPSTTAAPPATAETITSAASPAASPPDNRIIIQAVEESWIQVVTPTGGIVIEKLMVMGEIYRVPDRNGLVLNTGNAGALKLIVNGTLIPPIGEMGAVRRGIALSPEALLP